MLCSLEASTSTSTMASENTTNQKYDSHSKLKNHHSKIFVSNALFIVIISIISVIILLAVCLIIVLLKRLRISKRTRSWRGNNSVNSSNSNFTPSSTTNFDSSPDVRGGCLHGANIGRSSAAAAPKRLKGVQVFTYKELEVATNGFNEANVIHKGEVGVVYRGVLSDGTVAAIKMLRRKGKQVERAFRIEVDLLSRLHSPYLVELLGYCADQNHRLLIYEFMPNGNLHYHLHCLNDQQRTLDWGTRLRIALDCAMALEFLHEHAAPPVIHRNFKCANILLDKNFCAKVSDFGLAKMGSDKINGQTSARILGTSGYVAPEYALTGKLTTKSDVYSFGVVLLELLTGRAPIDSKRSAEEVLLAPWALPRLTNREMLVELVDPSLNGQYSTKELVQVAAIAAVCVQEEPDYRPLMMDVVQSLIPLVKNYSLISYSNSMRV